MLKFLREPKYVSKWAPVLSILLIDVGNFGHVWRMFSEQSAAGQSLISWSLIWGALLSWYNFYAVVTPGKDGEVARLSVILGMGMVSFIIGVIIYFRFLGG